MLLKHLFLQNFRNYTKSEFNFNEGTTLIIGPNAAGKTNLIEAIFFLAMGRSFRTENQEDVIKFEKEAAHVKGELENLKLEIVVAQNLRKYLVNGVSKRRADFAGNLTVVLFTPNDLEIIINSPALRRNFLDNTIIQVDRDYRIATGIYQKVLRQRNSLLEAIREQGIKRESQLEYWDRILIENGQVITEKRKEFIDFINSCSKDIFDFSIHYDQSPISEARLLQYEEAQLAAGVTLVGPHRDDLVFEIRNSKFEARNLRSFGSRGQQRLTILQLKLIELDFIEQKNGERPVLLLDDIFSELDSEHIEHILKLISGQQTVITTTHKEFIPKTLLKNANVIELE